MKINDRSLPLPRVATALGVIGASQRAGSSRRDSSPITAGAFGFQLPPIAALFLLCSGVRLLTQRSSALLIALRE